VSAPDPRYLHLRVRRPASGWPLLRLVAVGAVLALAALLVRRPETGLVVLWQVVVPLLPLVFVLAPGLWRQVCPMAAMTRAPRALGIAGRALPRRLRDHAAAVAIVLFLGLATARLSPLGESAQAGAALLVGALAAALLGGLVFRGKSGWCSTFCPLAPVQELYGQAPAHARATACAPCVGCVSHCADVSPRSAYAERLAAGGPAAAYRRLFAGLLPGFVLAFHLLPRPVAPVHLALLALVTVASLGVFLAIEALLDRRPARLPALFGALALGPYAWFNVPVVAGALETLFGLEAPAWALWEARIVAVAFVLVWLVRLARRRPATPAAVPAAAPPAAPAPRVTVLPGGASVAVPAGSTLLEAAEGRGLEGWQGCRNGVCGCDPVVVSAGAQHLSPPQETERATLRRLGTPPGTRLACRARVHGDVTLEPLPGSPAAAAVAEALAGDAAARGIARAASRPAASRRVVVVGAGAAGATAVETLRRLDPACEIQLVGDEARAPYDRTALPRAVHAGVPHDALRLHPEGWARDLGVAVTLATPAVRLDAQRRVLTLAGGEERAYDQLILTTGATPAGPVVPGRLPAGCFGLHTAEDAARVRLFAHSNPVHRALVAGGGVRGLEAADALHALGLAVTVVHRGPWLAHRQLDARTGALVADHLGSLGMEVVLESRVSAVHGDEAIDRVVLSDGRARAVELLVACTGLEPNIALARTGGLEIRRGVVVDDRMTTSAPGVLAAGDVAEHRHRVSGLWPTAVAQAEVAAAAALEHDAVYDPVVEAVTLRVGRVEVTALGRTTPAPGDREILVPDGPLAHRRLLLEGDRLVGAVLLGQPSGLVDGVRDALTAGRDLREHEPRLRAGDWDPLVAGVAAAA